METRQMTPFFSTSFAALIVCNIHFWYLKLVKIHFRVAPPLVYLIWPAK